jgi:hypothetical protein
MRLVRPLAAGFLLVAPAAVPAQARPAVPPGAAPGALPGLRVRPGAPPAAPADAGGWRGGQPGHPGAVVVWPAFGFPGWWGYGSGFGYGSGYAAAAAGAATAGAAPAPAERRPPPTRVIEVGPGAEGDPGRLDAAPAGDGLLRVRWAGAAGAARGVTLLVADSARRPLAEQTVYAAPYAAVFERAGRVAFVGATVVRADGGSTTTLVPLAAALGGR